jgi:putative iron-regulated protein
MFMKALTLLSIILCMASQPASAKMYVDATNSIGNYAKIAELSYARALKETTAFHHTIDALLAKPTEENLGIARKAWKKARYYYIQTEIFRFYDSPVDALEERINAWPIDAAFIDYTHYDQNAGLINSTQAITTEDLKRMHLRYDETEALLGWHAIEYLLWGEDLSVESAGTRPATDFDSSHPRRREYIKIATDILIEDLNTVKDAWSYSYSSTFTNASPEPTVLNIFKGLTGFTGIEMAGTYIGTPMVSGNQADESSQFSDNTHNDYLAAFTGIRNVWLGQYGTHKGEGMDDLLRKVNPLLADTILEQFIDAQTKIANLPKPYDKEILMKYPNVYLPIPEDYVSRKQLEKTMQSFLKLNIFFWQAMVEIGVYEWPNDKERLRYEGNVRFAN